MESVNECVCLLDHNLHFLTKNDLGKQSSPTGEEYQKGNLTAVLKERVEHWHSWAGGAGCVCVVLKGSGLSTHTECTDVL